MKVSLPEWLDRKMISVIGLCIVILVVVVGFFKKSVSQSHEEFKDNVVLDTSKDTTMFPYTTTPIRSLDQYELEAVFSNEGDRQLKKQQINQLTRRYPLDWTNYPPNSSKFQSEQAKYIEGFSSDSSAKNLNEPYQEMGNGNLSPPDTAALERDEKDILATYKPRKTKSITSYDVYDAQKLIEQIYKPKGIKACVERKEGNVFEVVKTRSLKNKIEYEDDLRDADVSSGSGIGPGEAVIDVPPVATETIAGRDPFYEATNSTRSSRTDYMRWTPGLERMFAPTNDRSDWIG
jgi:hypothetical protein